MRSFTARVFVAALLLAASVTAAFAHITPPVVLASDREVVASLLAGARRFFVREVRPSPAERLAIQGATGWAPDEDFYRFYVGRDAQGRLLAATVFLTEFTIHGPVRVAIALGPDGTVKGATVVELTEETYTWVKPLLDADFTRDYVGQDSKGRFGIGERVRAAAGSMTQFYGRLIGTLVQRAVILYEVTGIGRAG